MIFGLSDCLAIFQDESSPSQCLKEICSPSNGRMFFLAIVIAIRSKAARVGPFGLWTKWVEKTPLYVTSVLHHLSKKSEGVWLFDWAFCLVLPFILLTVADNKTSSYSNCSTYNPQ